MAEARLAVPSLAAPPLARSGQTLVEALDRVLDTGAVVDGHLVLSVAGVDLVYIGLRALLASVDSAGRLMAGQATAKASAS